MANKTSRPEGTTPQPTIGFRLRPEDLAAFEFLTTQTEWRGASNSDVFRKLLLREAADLGGPVAAPAGTPARKATSPRHEAAVSEEHPAAPSAPVAPAPALPPVPELPVGAVPPAGHTFAWLLAALPVGAAAAGEPLMLAPSPAPQLIEGPAPSAAPGSLPAPTSPAKPAAVPALPAAVIEAPSAPTTPRKGKGTSKASAPKGKAKGKPPAADEGAVDAGSGPPMPPKDAVKAHWLRFREEHPEQDTHHLVAATGVNRKRLHDLKVNETDLRALWRYLVSQGIDP